MRRRDGTVLCTSTSNLRWITHIQFTIPIKQMTRMDIMLLTSSFFHRILLFADFECEQSTSRTAGDACKSSLCEIKMCVSFIGMAPGVQRQLPRHNATFNRNHLPNKFSIILLLCIMSLWRLVTARIRKNGMGWDERHFAAFIFYSTSSFNGI